MGAYAEQVARFAAQFSDEDGKILYRKHGVGAAFRVDERERDEFIAAFKQTQRISKALLVGAILLWAGVFVGLMLMYRWNLDDPWKKGTAAIPLIVVSISFVWHGLRIYGVPERTLPESRRCAPPRGHDERKRKALTELSYIQLAIVPLVPLLLLSGRS